MWHETVAHAAALIAEESPPSTGTPVGAIAGLLTAVTAFVGAITGLVVVLRRSDRTETPAPPVPPIPLNSHADDEDEDVLRTRNRALETFLWRHGFNPNHILTGEEPDDAEGIRVTH